MKGVAALLESTTPYHIQSVIDNIEDGAQLSGLIRKYLIRKKSTIFVQRL